MANRPTARIGTGGSDGATRPPSATIVPARKARLVLPVANDNKPPLKRRLLRLFLYILLGALVTALVLV